MTTYQALGIPSARELRRCGHTDHTIDFLKAHNRELKRRGARAGNWGWVVDETGIASKTSKGILQTDIRSGQITHAWSYTDNQLDIIARHFNLFVQQDNDGNVVGNSSPDAETGWRPISRERCLEALAA